MIYTKSISEKRTYSKWGEQDLTVLKDHIEKKKALVIETLPPRGPDPKKYLDYVRSVWKIGVSAIAVTDMPLARIRVSPWAVSALMIQEGMEVLPHFSRITRNKCRVESDLLGFHILGVRNLLLLSGDDPNHGDYPDSSVVQDMSIYELIKLVKLMNTGTDLAGNKLNASTEFYVGAVFSHSFDEEVERVERKVKAGVDFLISQPVFEKEELQRFLDRLTVVPPVLVSTVVFKNRSQLSHFASVPGIVLPKEFIDLLEEDRSDEYIKHYTTDYILKVVDEIHPYVSGIYVAGIVRDLSFMSQLSQLLALEEY